MEIKTIEEEDNTRFVKPPRPRSIDRERQEILQHSVLRTKALIRFNYKFVSYKESIYFEWA